MPPAAISASRVFVVLVGIALDVRVITMRKGMDCLMTRSS
jgi:hypothetical protein